MPHNHLNKPATHRFIPASEAQTATPHPSPLCRSVLLVPTGDRLSRHLRVDRRYRRLITFSHEAYIQKRNPDPLRAPFVVCRSSPKLYLFSISRQNGTATLLFVRGAVYLTRESVSILPKGFRHSLFGCPRCVLISLPDFSRGCCPERHRASNV